MNYLVTGRAGTGKSSICQELSQRGFIALDGDRVPGLARWEDAATLQPVVVPDLTNVDSTRIHWNWNGGVLAEALSGEQDVFFCGSADNQLRFHEVFDKVFVLIVEPDIHEHRLLTRTGNAYGKHPDKVPKILDEQREFIEESLSLGAVAIDANRSLVAVVDDILRRCA